MCLNVPGGVTNRMVKRRCKRRITGPKIPTGRSVGDLRARTVAVKARGMQTARRMVMTMSMLFRGVFMA